MEKPEFSFYKRRNGHTEFEEFYQSLPRKDREKLYATLQAIRRQGIMIAIRMEWVKKLDKNLYEIRSIVGSNIQRACYFHVEGNQYIITHGFTKKTQKTPAREIKHAKEIRAEYFADKENDNER